MTFLILKIIYQQKIVDLKRTSATGLGLVTVGLTNMRYATTSSGWMIRFRICVYGENFACTTILSGVMKIGNLIHDLVAINM